MRADEGLSVKQNLAERLSNLLAERPYRRAKGMKEGLSNPRVIASGGFKHLVNRNAIHLVQQC
ncbi:hypothetical protein PHLCEN_2v8131 [Hermanssonia centrifuga]|uniref:Uncharacterized protein n=1 Tax=Hermanssonia centrifuga TaxID=98765 RepID=A0A2R6NUJ3_9APHY|nr:hypothetical protein PHLCEN_2v8131 [Hermanssonia centrifuga]